VKIAEGHKVGACSLACSISKVKRHDGVPSWLVCSWSTFGARMNHGQTQTHKTHHGLDLGLATTFPLIVFSMSSHGGSTQMSFCPRTPKLEPEILEIGTPTTLEGHNFMCKLLIEVMYEAKF
jgi:hypothetical protein